MRMDQMTSKLQAALSDAQSLAVGHDNNFIEPVHLVAALLDQKGGSVRPLLSQTGFNIADLRTRLQQLIDRLPKVQGNAGDVSLSNELGRMMNQADKLAQKILKGGSGVWGAVPMPANPQVNEAEAKTLATWVLGAK